MNNLSVVILTKDSEKTLVKCLSSVVKIASEIVIIDDESSDKTVSIAKHFKARVYRRKLEDFSGQRNYGLQKAKGEWVFFLDSDEIVSSKLVQEILRKITNTKINGYFIKRIDIFLGKKMLHGEVGNTRILRLAKKGKGIWKRQVHEYWKINGPVELMQNPMYHYSHKSIEEFINAINSFSTLHAISNNKEEKKSSVLKIIVWPMGKFIDSYILKFGFLDGFQGFIYAFMMSIHSCLSWTKLWLIQKQK